MSLCKRGHDKDIVGRYGKACKKCALDRSREWYKNNRDRHFERTHKIRLAHPERYQRYSQKHRAKKYGMTLAQREEAMKLRNHRCDICISIGDLTPKTLCQDHDKLTGQNRGMLCKRHNFGISHFNHSPAELIAACEYMKKHAQLKLVS